MELYFALPPIDPTEAALPVPEQLKRIRAQVFGPGIDSHTRLLALLRLIWDRPPEVFWPALIDTCDMCDDTWWLRPLLLDLMRSQQALPYVQPLQWPVQIYRGCSRPRVRGVSWTMDRKVAEGFARGHRGISVPDPVVAEAVVERVAVFAMLNEREESELLIDPRRLRKLTVHKWEVQELSKPAA
jgi:hypothetical protein